MMALALVVDPQAPTLSRWLDHVDHAVAVMSIEHVGFGADFFDKVAPAEPANGSNARTVALDESRLGLGGVTGQEDYPTLIAALTPTT